MGFARQAAFTYFVRVVLIPVGLLNTMIIARWLGPAGQGVYAAVGAYIAIFGMLGSVGLATAVTQVAAADPGKTGALVANARLTGGLTGLAALVVLVGLRWLLPDAAFGDIPFALMVLASLALPFGLVATQLRAVLLGRQRVRAYNATDAFERLYLLFASLVLVVGFGFGVVALIAAATALAVVKVAVLEGLLRPHSGRFRTDLPLLRKMGTVSARAYVASLLAFLVLRSDVVLINGMLDSTQTGIYSVAVRLADLLLVLPTAVGTILFPRVAATRDSGSPELTALVCRHIVFLVTLSCLALAAGGGVLVRLLFGAPYESAALSLWLLLPGIWCMSVQVILANDLAGRDYPRVIPAVWTVVLGLNVALNLAWIPTYGIAGAAAASSLAYLASCLAIATYWLRRFPDVRPVRLLVLRPDEIRGLGARLRTILHPGSVAG